MKKSSILCGVIIIASFILSACNSKNADEQGSKDKTEQELRDTNNQFYTALNAMFTGNVEPMNEIWSHSNDVTDLGPFGGDRLVGWKAVGAEFQREADLKLGGKVNCKDLLVFAGKDIGYTVCVEEGENIDAEGKPIIIKFRATNIFRLENGQWKMVHHHTDLSTPLQEATSKDKK